MEALSRLLFLIIVAGILVALVRPGGKGAQAVQVFTDAATAVVGMATGYTAREV